MGGASTAILPEMTNGTRTLLLRYIAAIGNVANDPAVSIKSFFILLWKVFCWVANLVVVPVIFVADVLIFIWNRFANRKKAYLQGVSVHYTLAALRSLHQGEIPFLKFLTLRFVTELFVMYHIHRRVERISLGLQNQELVQLISGQHAEEAEMLKCEAELLEKFRTNLTSRMKVEIRVLLLLVPYLPIALTFVNVQKTEDLPVRVYKWLSSPTGPSRPIFFGLISSVCYGLWVFVSSFIRKREVMRQNNLYSLEQELFAKLGVPSLHEFPVDLFAWSFFVLILVIPLVIQLRLVLEVARLAGFLPDADVLMNLLWTGIAWFTPFMYAFYRRVRTKNL